MTAVRPSLQHLPEDSWGFLNFASREWPTTLVISIFPLRISDYSDLPRHLLKNVGAAMSFHLLFGRFLVQCPSAQCYSANHLL